MIFKKKKDNNKKTENKDVNKVLNEKVKNKSDDHAKDSGNATKKLKVNVPAKNDSLDSDKTKSGQDKEKPITKEVSNKPDNVATSSKSTDLHSTVKSNDFNFVDDDESVGINEEPINVKVNDEDETSKVKNTNPTNNVSTKDNLKKNDVKITVTNATVQQKSSTELPHLPISPDNNKQNDAHTKESHSKSKFNFATSGNKSSKSTKSLGVATIKDYGSVILILGIAFLLGFFVIIPQYKAFVANKKTITKLEERSMSVGNHLKYLQKLSDLEGELEENQELSRQAIPNEEDVPFFLNQIINIADISGVDLLNLSFGGISDSSMGKDLKAINARVGVAGTYDEIVTFLQNLENSRKILYADNIGVTITKDKKVSSKSVSPDTDEEDISAEIVPTSDTYKLTLSITSYYMPDPDTNNLTIERITSQPNFDEVIEKIKSMKHYEPAEFDIEVGTLNPFTQDEETNVKISKPSSLEENNMNEDEFDGFGIKTEDITPGTNAEADVNTTNQQDENNK